MTGADEELVTALSNIGQQDVFMGVFMNEGAGDRLVEAEGNGVDE
jgi:hypothetical protein